MEANPQGSDTGLGERQVLGIAIAVVIVVAAIAGGLSFYFFANPDSPDSPDLPVSSGSTSQAYKDLRHGNTPTTLHPTNTSSGLGATLYTQATEKQNPFTAATSTSPFASNSADPYHDAYKNPFN